MNLTGPQAKVLGRLGHARGVAHIEVCFYVGSRHRTDAIVYRVHYKDKTFGSRVTLDADGQVVS